MIISITLRRFLIPQLLVTIYYLFKYRCKISLRAEVDFSPFLHIGRNTQISSFAKIKALDGPLSIGKNSSIASGCFVGSDKMGIEIGNDCLISSNVSIIGNNYKYERLDIPIRLQGLVSKGIKIGDNVWIGSGSCILDGAVIGSGVIITPNSVVSSKVADNSIIQGNPARVIFTRR